MPSRNKQEFVMSLKSNHHGPNGASQKVFETSAHEMRPELRRNTDLPEALSSRYMEVSAGIAVCLAAASRFPEIEVLQPDEIIGSSDVVVA
jgi:hypothetical protein